MKKFIIGGFIISVILAVFFSPFASSFPDGLERVAKDLGFIHREVGAIVKSPIPDYTFPFVRSEKLATSLAGLFGTLIVFVVAYGSGYIIKNLRKG